MLRKASQQSWAVFAQPEGKPEVQIARVNASDADQGVVLVIPEGKKEIVIAMLPEYARELAQALGEAAELAPQAPTV